MTKSPLLWISGLAIALGGAVAGNALGSTPVIGRSAIGAFYQSHEDSAFADDTSSDVLPDHYPLVTRRGTVPVAELADRGLYSQARYRDVYAAADYDRAAFAQVDYAQDFAEPRYEGQDESLRIGDPVPQRRALATERAVVEKPSSPLALEVGPATLSPASDAKLIDVTATLAMR